jgi:hypothetical protein
VVFGLLGWVGATLVFIFKAFPGRGQFQVRPAMIWGGVLVASFIVWIVAMLHA